MLIAVLEEILPSGYHILYTWHIIKDIMARETTKYFPDPEQPKDRMSLWYSVCQTPTLQEYEQAKAELQIRDPVVYLRGFEIEQQLLNYCTDMESRVQGAKGLTSRSIRLFSPNPHILSSRPIPIHSISDRV